MGQVAVVGQQQQALAVGVEAPDVEQPLGTVGDEVADGGTAAVVGHRAQHAARLVQGEVDEVGADDDAVAVDVDDGRLRVDAGPQLTATWPSTVTRPPRSVPR